ncbi:MAG TPA: hypothetical protein VIG46_03475 [Candidatus Baltobacteraceae bacterium]|jgi:hypothetical protein
MKRLILIPLLIAALLGVGPSGQLTATQPAAHALVEKMLAANPSLASYRARVHVDTRMLSFPWLAPKLDGTTYFKRPNDYEVVFDRVPSYAKGFEKLFNDVGDPSSWEKDSYLALDADRTLDGKSMLVIRMTKKIYSTTIDHTLAYVDPATHRLARMEFYYRNGGFIAMDQKFRTEGSYQLIDKQHADIAIPHVHAVADATYGAYQTNVAVDPSVFAKK